MPYITNILSLPRTRQTASFAVGDDGDHQAGQRRPLTRFCDRGDGTVLDRHTGLQWVKQPERIIPGQSGQTQNAQGDWQAETNYIFGDVVQDDAAAGGDGRIYICIDAISGSTHPRDDATHWVHTPWTAGADVLGVPTMMTWTEALGKCEALEYAGRSDWRLPNILELLSIVDFSKADGIPSELVLNPGSDKKYWSSTTDASNGTGACAMVFQNGLFFYRYDKQVSYYPLPVRGGQVEAE